MPKKVEISRVRSSQEAFVSVYADRRKIRISGLMEEVFGTAEGDQIAYAMHKKSGHHWLAVHYDADSRDPFLQRQRPDAQGLEVFSTDLCRKLARDIQTEASFRLRPTGQVVESDGYTWHEVKAERSALEGANDG